MYGNLLLTEVTVKGCKANEGGGLYQSSSVGETTIVSSKFENNQAIPVGGNQGAGGGMLTVGNTIVVNNSVVTGNQGAKGGGIAIIGGSAAVSLSGTEVSYNIGTTVEGGIYHSGHPFDMNGGSLPANSTN